MPRKLGEKAEAVRQAVRANPEKLPKEIAELVKGQGFDVSPGYVSTIKFKLKRGRKGKRKKKAAAPTAPAAAPAAVAADAVSLALLRKAKKLAAELGGVKEAKVALNALAQLVD